MGEKKKTVKKKEETMRASATPRRSKTTEIKVRVRRLRHFVSVVNLPVEARSQCRSTEEKEKSCLGRLRPYAVLCCCTGASYDGHGTHETGNQEREKRQGIE